jgi:Dolichyl-phosphate-mannose-protein mannosyltransferase
MAGYAHFYGGFRAHKGPGIVGNKIDTQIQMSSADTPVSLRNNPKALVRVALLALALLGFISVLITTRWGAGTSPDSVVYIAGSRNLAAGHGFSTVLESGEVQAITYHAPFYSDMLALLDLGGLDPLQGARWLNALLFAGNILLVGFLLQELLPYETAEACLAPVIGAGLILFPAMMVEIHSMAWSESLFIFLSLSGFWALSRFLNGQSTRYLIGSAILVALAFLSRYIGIVLVVAGGLSILLFSERSLRRRLADGLLFALISAGPMGLWLLRNALAGGTATGRELLFHSINRQQLGLAVTTLGSWVLIPESSSALVKALPYLALGLVIAAVVFIKHIQYQHRSEWARWVTLSALPRLIRIILVFIPLYLAFLLVSLSFLDANTPLDSRIFSPIYVTGVILAIYFLTEGLKWLRWPAVVRYALISISFILLVGLAKPSLDFVLSSYTNGIGFTSRWWRESPTLAALTSYPTHLVVYTNAPEALYLYTQRASRAMPKKFESANQRPNEAYNNELMELKAQIINRKAIIVYFDSTIRPTLPGRHEIEETLELDVLEQTADGVIYGIK